MSTYKDDLKGAKQLINEDYGSFGYYKVYYSSNEYLPQLFNQFSIKDKDVFTVVGSGDQVLYSYYKGARSVDTYDINILTKYYYYLRKWCIEYLDICYPNEDLLFYNTEWIYNLLKLVNCSNEEEENAYNFWREYVYEVFPFDIINMYYCNNGCDNNRISNLSKLKELIKGKKINFKELDIFKEISIDKKYDIIITSNILETAHSEEDLIIARDNLYNLLNDSGEIICSYIMDEPKSLDKRLEKEIFSEYFEKKDFKGTYSSYFDRYYPVGYSYIKR